MEAHLVHKGEHGQLAIVAVLIDEGKENAFINTLWHNLPKDQGKEHAETDLKINANELLPKDFSYYTYLGSPTTPPYSEIVNWFVLKTPIEISEAELHKFTSLFKSDARPIQPVHGRIVKESN
jgi:carbonic anhydrase